MILHIDMDAFYASVEQRDRPELRGKPVVVGGGSQRGVVTAASYEARQYGIHSAMPGRRAVELCPHAIFVKSRHEHYANIGRQVRGIFHRYTPVVQPLSLDEAFLDVSGVMRLHGDAETIGHAIKNAIQTELQLTASVGIAPLKFLAKIASDFDKPNGFVVIGSDDVQAFLDPLEVSRLWGVGKVGQTKLTRLGYRYVRDLRQQSADSLRGQLGTWGEHLWRLANGIDARHVVVDHLAKGIGHERTFETDLTDAESLTSVISHLSEQVARRLRSAKRTASKVTLKYRRDDFKTYTRARKLSQPTDSTSEIFQVAETLLLEMRQRQPRGVRLVGVSLGSLSEIDAPQQLSLFAEESGQASESKLDRLSDQISGMVGKKGLYRASSHGFLHGQRKRDDPS
ncbi:DNA polymerase-4 [Neorhodopirellula lusitana]|uniref:DNA polymerase IV n=1 Tax=Neorhodopirellula lusitana TaxID=445327 RepID=A0ABY1Q4C7_9BACT|nr:DNA polymerase IV [Neorhodopirellula lusitana]SMP59333.1 DNA polymerase-4 [Neorhodopirellula lusitana]